MNTKERVLISPLNWGLGHATRCIPIIKQLLSEGKEVVLATSGSALACLRNEFPSLEWVDFRSFTLRYSKGKSQTLAVALQFPYLVYNSIWEHFRLKKLIQQYRIDTVISDNRFGLYSKKVKCIYLTHQLWIKLPKGFGWMEPLVSRMHCAIIKKYCECWVPDFKDAASSLAGELSHIQNTPQNVRYIGPLSRFTTDMTLDELYTNASKQSKRLLDAVNENPQAKIFLAVISGVEPTRTLFEKQILEKYQSAPYDLFIVVRGLVSPKIKIEQQGSFTLCSHLDTPALQYLIAKASHIVCRSGYSSIMDLSVMGKMGVTEFYPTPGQSEQVYLFRHLAYCQSVI